MNRKPLLFLVSESRCDQRTAVSATAAWIAKAAGAEFDAYIPVELFRRPGMSPITPPFNGQWHGPQFYFLSNCFDMTFCSLTSTEVVPFRREATTFGARVLPQRKQDDLASFYGELLATYGLATPDTVVVIPPRDDEVDKVNLEPYCYPEIYYRQALGATTAAPDAVFEELRAAGVSKAVVVFCSTDTAERLERLGFQVEVADSIAAGDSMGSTTTRITERWKEHGKGVVYGSQPIMVKMLPFNMRHDYLPLFEYRGWQEFGKTVSTYAHQFGNPLVWGNQAAELGVGDKIVAEYGKYDVAMSLGAGVSGPTVQETLQLAPDWMPAAPAPWEDEYSEEFLEQKARDGAIPVCFLWYAADLGHVTCCVRLFDVMAAWYGRCGLALPSTWYDFYAPLLQLMYQPAKLGGVSPRVEPLVGSVGIGVGTEGHGFLKRETLLGMLRQSIADIKRHVGDNKVPLGYLPFQDANPYYQRNTAQPQYDVPLEAGFDYAITTRDEADPPKIMFQDGDYIVINRQEEKWFVRESLLRETQLWEKQLVGSDQGAWVMIDLDAPFWFQVPVYYDPDLPGHYQRAGFESTIVEYARALKYVERGGDSGKLFLAKPHELIRYIRVLQRRGKPVPRLA